MHFNFIILLVLYVYELCPVQFWVYGLTYSGKTPTVYVRENDFAFDSNLVAWYTYNITNLRFNKTLIIKANQCLQTVNSRYCLVLLCVAHDSNEFLYDLFLCDYVA